MLRGETLEKTNKYHIYLSTKIEKGKGKRATDIMKRIKRRITIWFLCEFWFLIKANKITREKKKKKEGRQKNNVLIHQLFQTKPIDRD